MNKTHIVKVRTEDTSVEGVSSLRPKKVAIFTTFTYSDTSYSLNNVVEDQIKMFTDNGYEPIVIVAEGFVSRGEYDKVQLETIPSVPCHNQVKIDPTFDEDVAALRERIEEIITKHDIGVVLTHDIVYQPAALKHNLASRYVALKTGTRWLHWIHSATSPLDLIQLRALFKDKYLDVIQTPFPNSKYIFFNHFSKGRIAKNFGVKVEDVEVVYHPIDICEYLGFHPLTRQLVNDKKLLEADAVCIYPIRLDEGKQVQYVLKTMAALRYFKKNLRDNFSIRIIICDFHSSSSDPKDPKFQYRERLKKLAEELQLSDIELTFTSEWHKETKVSCPRQMVRDLFLLSNVYIHPSVSESYSLTTQEAGVCNNVVVLNEDFPPMLDIYGNVPIYRKFSSNINAETGMDGSTNTEYKDEEAYHTETASLIARRLNMDSSLVFSRMLIKTRNHQYVFKNMLEPLLYGKEKPAV